MCQWYGLDLLTTLLIKGSKTAKVLGKFCTINAFPITLSIRIQHKSCMNKMSKKFEP